MAISSLSASAATSTILHPLSLSNSSTSNFASFFFLSVHNGNNAFKPLHSSSTRLYAAPQVLNSSESVNPPPQTLDDEPDSTTFQVGDSETRSASSVSIAADADTMAPKQKIRIKLRSYWVPLIEDSCKQILDAARTTNAKTMGPVPLPTKKRIYCVLKSPHVHKDARFHFEIRTHQRIIDILYPTAQTIDSLMQLDIPAGVDVEVKL
ncbi:hypothetical protein Lal_00027314 [Lupinus albus]|uniref:Small ribosomal subunit protein uS10c n=1 Tax=Lupinus albus TaxID=3870 RepID=A0A6A4QGS5_LUPAL|nr:putative ribosomal protein S10 [Lupinus albus]KAF1873276.1 hypothetical protein Lal_00027314 [Lupinus albus]